MKTRNNIYFKREVAKLSSRNSKALAAQCVSTLKPFYAYEDMLLYLGDCLEVIKYLKDNCIDLVICSPPYNLDLGNKKRKRGYYDIYKDNMEHTEYIKWLRSIFQNLYPKLTRGGRVAINIADPKNGKVINHVDIATFMVQIGYIPLGQLIWYKSQVSNRLAVGSWRSPSCPSFPTPFEYILIFAKETRKLPTKGVRDLSSKDFLLYSYALWKIAPENQMKKYGHPAMMPVEIPRRLIQMLSWSGSTVLDPFNGLGTTGVACQELGSKYIGIELSEKYCLGTVNRWKNAKKAA